MESRFLFYAVVLKFCWLVAVWGVIAYAVFGLDRSPWWFLLAVLLSSGTYEKETMKKEGD